VNKKLKSQLKKVFEVPAPANKTEFLRSINFPKTNRLDFILSQIRYIRKRVWIISFLLVTVVLIGLRFSANVGNMSFLSVISSILPFVSLMTVTEIARSASYNMAELEMSCKYNFVGIVLARLGILSFFNIAIFGILILAFHDNISLGMIRPGIYLLVPFMLTCLLSLFTINRFRSKETTYICGIISCFIGIANALFTTQYAMAFSDKYFYLWSYALIILVLFTIGESIKFIKKTEELQWNSL